MFNVIQYTIPIAHTGDADASSAVSKNYLKK